MKNNKGITLIALSLTIIVLLIISGITIASLTGENGLIIRASNAKTKSEEADEIEMLQEVIINIMKESETGDVEISMLETALEGNTQIESINEDTDGITVKFKSGREYVVFADGRINKK